MQPEPERIQIHDGIGHELTGTVVGDVAAAIGLFDHDACPAEGIARREQMRSRIGPPRNRDDRGIVLNEQQVRVRPPRIAGAKHAFVMLELDAVSARIRKSAEVEHGNGVHDRG